MNKKQKKIPVEKLSSFYNEIFKACGFSPSKASIAASGLMHADLYGYCTHGFINLINIYLPMLENKKISSRASPKIIRKSKACTHIDGNGALGYIVGNYAMQKAINNARKYGIGCAAVRNSTHAGSFGFYTKQAVDAGMVGIALTNLGSQGLIPPPGGTDLLFGTNVIAVAAPTNKKSYFSLDMSTSAVSAGKIRQYAKEGKRIPNGWLQNKKGEYVQDPKEFINGNAHLAFIGTGSMEGSYKGYGLAMLADILCGILSGGNVGPNELNLNKKDNAKINANGNVGHFFIAINPEVFVGIKHFMKTLDNMLAVVKNSKPIKRNEPVLYPGLLEHMIKEKNIKLGLIFSEESMQAMHEITNRYGITSPVNKLLFNHEGEK